eukprot:scaffold150602_cov35-Tisochrysis_lutea.AAC.1
MKREWRRRARERCGEGEERGERRGAGGSREGWSWCGVARPQGGVGGGAGEGSGASAPIQRHAFRLHRSPARLPLPRVSLYFGPPPLLSHAHTITLSLSLSRAHSLTLSRSHHSFFFDGARPLAAPAGVAGSRGCDRDCTPRRWLILRTQPLSGGHQGIHIHERPLRQLHVAQLVQRSL